MEKLSKLRIAENLKLYYAITENARTTPNKTYLEIYYELCDSYNFQDKNEDRFHEIIATSILTNLISLTGITKDEYLQFMKRDTSTNQRLSFLDSCFVNGCNPSDFNKVDVIMYIRNAFFHSNDKELYSINEDLSVDITMPGISLYLHLDIDTLRKICMFVNGNTQRAYTYQIENEQSVNVEMILKDEKSCIEELSKIKIKKIQNKNKSSSTHIARSKSLPQKEMREIENIVDYIIDPTKTKEEFVFTFSTEQCQSIAKEIMIYKKYLSDQVLSIFINQIIISNIEHGVMKYEQIFFDALVASTFILRGDKNFLEMTQKLNLDLFDFIGGHNLSQDNFFKNRYHDYGVLNGDIYKILYIYLFRLALMQNQNLSNYYVYVYTNLVKEFVDEEDEHIRNAFTHKRFIWLEGTDSSKTSICLFDNENDVRRPVNIPTASWSKTYTIEEMNKRVEAIYIKHSIEQGIPSGITFG